MMVSPAITNASDEELTSLRERYVEDNGTQLHSVLSLMPISIAAARWDLPHAAA